MVEIRKLTARQRPPNDGDWVFIEQAGGRYVANGSVRQAGGSVLFFRPTAFMTFDEALNASKAWAFDNSVPTVYVRGDDKEDRAESH